MPDERHRLAARMICAGFTPENRHVIDELIDAGIGAVVLFSRNITGGPEQVAELVAALKSKASSREPTARGPGTGAAGDSGGGRLLVAIDHEGGRVMRMSDGYSVIPSMPVLGRAFGLRDDVSLARE